MNNDVVLLLILLAFFGVCVLFVKACDAIIGPDEEVLGAEAGEPDPEALEEAA